ncbi:MAG TPA: GNAT family N-acetyltransferase [Methyloceanibacter sp.]|jgi:ribosomal protein S18 acetylase RimI-like enzyme
MSTPARFAEARYELPLRSGGTLEVAPLAAADGACLGAIFAAIDPWAVYGYPAAALSNFLSDTEPGAPRLALQIGAEVAGAAVIRTAWLRGPYLQFFGVVPAHQNHGLGSAVLAWMEAEARAAEERNLWVAVSEINSEAQRLYEHHGFTPAARLDDLAWDGRTEILMRKRL